MRTIILDGPQGLDPAVIDAHIQENYARFGPTRRAPGLARQEWIEQAVQTHNDALDHRLGPRRQHGPNRADAAAGTWGGLSAKQLDFVYTKVLEEKFAARTASQLFATDSSVPAGARTHTVRRIRTTGRAQVWRGKDTVLPTVQHQQVEETFPVHHYVIAVEWDTFDQQSADYANLPLLQLNLKGAKRGLEDFLNEMTWKGHEELKIRGVLNYPYLAKTVSSVKFDGTATPDDMLAELHRQANYASITSKGVFSSTDVGFSPEVLALITSKVRSSNSDTTVLEMFLKSNPRITKREQVHEVPELAGVGPGGTDGILWFRKQDEDTIANSLPQGPTITPIQTEGLLSRQIFYISHGGVIMRDVGNSLLAFVEA